MPAMKEVRIDKEYLSAYFYKFAGLDGTKHSQDFGAVRQHIRQAA
jgi:hypothetical protein